jgi:hypothetical protein
MLRIVMRGDDQWMPARDIFKQALLEEEMSPFVVWMRGNSARAMPVTKALGDVISEFPQIERKKEGSAQGARVYFRRKVS